jgi:hypothetical protein
LGKEEGFQKGRAGGFPGTSKNAVVLIQNAIEENGGGGENATKKRDASKRTIGWAKYIVFGEWRRGRKPDSCGPVLPSLCLELMGEWTRVMPNAQKTSGGGEKERPNGMRIWGENGQCQCQLKEDDCVIQSEVNRWGNCKGENIVGGGGMNGRLWWHKFNLIFFSLFYFFNEKGASKKYETFCPFMF